MWRKFMAWLKEECPLCHQRFVHHAEELFPTRGCPEGHYKVVTHYPLDVQIHYPHK